MSDPETKASMADNIQFDCQCQPQFRKHKNSSDENWTVGNDVLAPKLMMSLGLNRTGTYQGKEESRYRCDVAVLRCPCRCPPLPRVARWGCVGLHGTTCSHRVTTPDVDCRRLDLLLVRPLGLREVHISSKTDSPLTLGHRSERFCILCCNGLL